MAPPRGGTARDGPDALRKFLVELATDPAQLGRYVRDPDGALADAELSDDDRAIVRSGHAGAIHARLSGVTGAAALLVVDVKPGEGGAEEPQVRVPGEWPLMLIRPLITILIGGAHWPHRPDLGSFRPLIPPPPPPHIPPVYHAPGGPLIPPPPIIEHPGIPLIVIPPLEFPLLVAIPPLIAGWQPPPPPVIAGPPPVPLQVQPLQLQALPVQPPPIHHRPVTPPVIGGWPVFPPPPPPVIWNQPWPVFPPPPPTWGPQTSPWSTGQPSPWSAGIQ
jgi:hypothetical protein